MAPYKQVNFSTVDDAVTRVGWHAKERLKEVSSWSKKNIPHTSLQHIDKFKVTEFTDVSSDMAHMFRCLYDGNQNLK